MEVLFSCAPGDEPSVLPLAQALSPAAPLFSTPGLKSFAAAISLCNIFVTVQGGPMHLAAAAGRPVVGLFGRQDPDIWHPWKVPHRVLWKDGDLSAIEPEDAAGAVRELLLALEPEN
jgi:ADP-heptose:LPS heptosyltransferase